MSVKNKQVIDQVNAAFAKNNVEGFLGFCTDDVAWTMVGDKHVKGKDAIRQWMKSMSGEAPKFTVTNVIAEGDFVMAYGDMTMKDESGTPTPYSYCDVYRFRGDKIAELTSYVIKSAKTASAAPDVAKV